MDDKRPTKKEMKYAFENPFLCPSCGHRFPSYESRELHLLKFVTCHKAFLEGSALIQAAARTGERYFWNKFGEWKKCLPINVFKKI